MPRVITIDGPAGSGKSSAAKLLAERLGWFVLDTGAMYRAVALAAVRAGVNLDDDVSLGRLARGLNVRFSPALVVLDGEDVTRAIRDPEITRASSRVAASPAVRACLVGWQREFAASNDTVTEGRDQGTVVFPDADHKFFLTANEHERARRRQSELQARNDATSFEDVLNDQRERDARDAERAVAPLRPADDAKVIDTTGLDLLQVVEVIYKSIHDGA